MRIWGEELSAKELMKRLGSTAQGFGVRPSVLSDGPGRGMRVVDVDTGSGLSFTVLPDRGLDIGACRFQGVPVAFVSKTGYVSPFLFEHGGTKFLRGFTAGLLTTCGFTQAGSPCVDGDEELGLHGRATSLPADEVAARGEWTLDEYRMTVSGVIRESAVFGENLCVRRSVTATAGQSVLVVRDRVKNEGYDERPLMLMYHCNFGWPLVSPKARMFSSAHASLVPRTDEAQKGISTYASFDEPTHRYMEQCFYHEFVADNEGYVQAGIRNPALNLEAYLRYRNAELPCFTQWKQMGEADYACGLEPGNTYPVGRAEARKSGSLVLLAPGEEREFTLEIGVRAPVWPHL